MRSLQSPDPKPADFLRDHHYLHKLPANRFRFGLHRGADLVRATIEKTADEYAFALSQLASPESRPTASR